MEARSELSTLTAAWFNGGGDQFVRYTGIRLVPLTGLPDDARQALLGFGAVLLGAATLVLIIAAANVSTLLAMRAAARRREMGIRTALGAGRGRLVCQLLTENLTLFLLGGLGGVLVAMAGTAALERLPIPNDQGLSLELSPDVRVLLFALAISLAVGLIFGIVPALRSASRTPVALLRTSSAGGGRRTWTSNALIVAQMTCSLVLLTTAGLFVRAVIAGSTIDPGFDARHVAIAAQHAVLRVRREQGPRVLRGVAAPSRSGAWRAVGDVRGSRPADDVEFWGFRDRRWLRRGREAAPRDCGSKGASSIAATSPRWGFASLPGETSPRATSPAMRPVAIVNETFVRRAWPNQSPSDVVGRTYLAGTRVVTIVGVAGDSNYSTLSEPATPFVYRPQAQVWGAAQTLFVRVSGDPAAATRLVQEAVAQIDPLLPRTAVTTLEREASTALLPQRVAAMVTGVLGVAGLVLAAIGLYGLVSYGVTLRLREIGVRLALGASRGDVVQMVLAQGLRLTAVGAALGLVASIFATRLVRSYLLDVSALDAVAFTGALIVLVTIAVIAAIIPARRAGAADPLVVLRTE